MTEPMQRVQELMAGFGAQWDGAAQDWKDVDGCSYTYPFDVLQVHEFGFCGCGLIGGALPYVRKGLRYISNRMQGSAADGLCPLAAFWVESENGDAVKQRRALGDEPSAYFFFWWADEKGYTDHGSCLPGWLTDKGKALLELLDLLAAEPEWEGER